jgi:hypothetical protein
LFLKPQANFIVVNKLAPVGLCHAFRDDGPETDRLFHQAQSSAFHDMLSIRTGVSGDPRKLGFLLRRETDFHAPGLGNQFTGML